MFLRAFFTTLTPPALLLIPFFLHKSQFPAFGSYSVKYAAILGCAVLLTLAYALIIALLCWRKKSATLSYNLFLSWLSGIALLVFCEIILRQTKLNDVFSAYNKNGQQKALMYGFKNDYDHTWIDAGAIHHTDKQGFRRHLRLPHWQTLPGQEYLFALGGSSAFGYRLNDEQCWPTLLDQSLSEDDSKIVVINAGNNGHNSVQMLLQSYFNVAPHKPTHLLIYQNRNDAQERPVAADEVFIDKEIVFSTTLVDYLKAIDYGSFYFESILGHLTKTALGKFFIKRERMQRVESGIKDMPEERLTLLKEHNGARYKRNLKALTTLARMEDIEPVFITFLHNPEGMAEHKSLLITHLNTVMRELAAEMEVPLIDLEEQFRSIKEKAPYFQDDAYHPSAKGAQFIARNVREDLLKILSKD